MSNNMCYYPWVGLEINSQEEYRPCCFYKNIVATSLDEYVNSEELKKIKDEFLQGLRPAGCEKCWRFEDAGVKSKRQIDWEYVLESKVPDLNKIKILGLTFGNSCNLACRTCLSAFSSSWKKEEEKLQRFGLDIKIYKHNDFYKNTNTINKIKDMCGQVTHVTISGGEPFLAGIDEHLDFIDFLLNTNPTNISLYYITNATVFPKQEFWNRWKHFKYVNLLLSIDGIGDKFEYLRWPAKWSSVEENIKQYKDKKFKNIKVEINHTVSLLNVLYLPKFLQWCLKNGLNFPNLNLAAYPQEYNMQSLPTSVKQQITRDLKKNKKFDNIVEFMNSQDLPIDKFITLTGLLDKQRNQSFNETFPELNQLLKESGCQI